YASIFAALGVRETLIDKRDRLMPFVDREITDEFCHPLRENRTPLRMGESVDKLEIIEDEHGARVRIHLESGKTIVAEKALYSVGRTGATSKLNLAEAGLVPDSRGRLTVDEHYRTALPDVYAVGDMVGFPALASTSMEQGRWRGATPSGSRRRARRSASPTASTRSRKSRWSARTRRS